VKEYPHQQRVLLTIVDVITRLLQPICPFVTEAMWPHIHSFSEGSVEGISMTTESLAATSSWPDLSGLQIDFKTASAFEKAQVLITAIRGARSSQKVNLKRRIDLLVPEEMFLAALEHLPIIGALAGVGVLDQITPSSDGFAVLVDGKTILLANMFDEAEAAENNTRLAQEITTLEKKVAGFKGRLANESYVNNAPDHVVQETKDMLAKCETELEAAKEALSE
jgi:valyl-tRNA synthetase